MGELAYRSPQDGRQALPSDLVAQVTHRQQSNRRSCISDYVVAMGNESAGRVGNRTIVNHKRIAKNETTGR